jgi:hypothetical protein
LWPLSSSPASAKIARTLIFSLVLLHPRDSTLSRLLSPSRQIPLQPRRLVSPVYELKILLAFEREPKMGLETSTSGRGVGTEDGIQEFTSKSLMECFLLCELFTPTE